MPEDEKSVSTGLVEQVEPLIAELPEDKQAELRSIIHAVSFQGPLPPPSLLAQYNELIPNGAERLMAQLEKQTTHRIAMEVKLVAAEVSLPRTGQWMAFVLALFFGGIAAALGFTGHDVLGGTIAVSDIAGLAAIFIYGRQRDQSPSAEEEKPKPPEQRPRPSAKRRR
jgi:uncharacterized membrane protein